MHQTFRRQDIRNRILAALPPSELEAIHPHLEPVRLLRGQVVYEPGDQVKRLYFIESGLVALIKTMHDGRSAMVGSSGIEGLTTPTALLAASPTNVEYVVQIPGTAQAIDFKTLRHLMDTHSVLRDLVWAYSWHLVEQLVQIAACNRLHSLEQRYAKLLLTGYNNIVGDNFELTQEFLAMTLGVQRSRISVVAGLFQRAKLIEYHHGRMRILDPEGLKALVCECYDLIRLRNEHLFARELTAR